MCVLRDLSARYIAARRVSGELRTRLIAILHERNRWLDQTAPGGANPSFAQRQLADVERVRRALERSARTATDRALAIEAVIGAVVRQEGVARVRAARAAGASVGRQPGRAVRPDPSLRGGWTPPAPEAEGVRQPDPPGRRSTRMETFATR